MSGGVGAIITAAGALLIVLVLLALGARLIRTGVWSGHPRTGKLLTIQETVALDTRRRLHLVQCGQRQVLLLTGGTQDVVVGWISGS
jgi:flagellar protein FliO/FliZ